MRRTLLAFALAVVPSVLGCSSSSAAPTGATGGPVQGAADTHCSEPTKHAQVVSSASCHSAPAGDAGAQDASMMDAATGMDAMPMSPFGPTRYGTEADDDDCKYHVAFTVSPVRQNEDVTFTLDVTTLADGQPNAGAIPDAEVYLDATHPAPNSGQHPTEISPGHYTVGPIRFDASGRWTVRFHLHEDCEDFLEDSPHGHVAFFIDVP
jgi:hypothetical protein